MITGKELAEKLYSESEEYYEDERLYSTGDNDLDELLERAFCDGYEYAQREFGNKENKAARKMWEAEQGKGIKSQDIGLFRVANADDLAKTEIQLAKNGATNDFFQFKGEKRPHGKIVKAGDLMGVRRGAHWKGENWGSIPVSEDAINRRKFRNSTKNYPTSDLNNVDQAINRRAKHSKFDFEEIFKKDKDTTSIMGQDWVNKRREERRKYLADDMKKLNKNSIFGNHMGGLNDYAKKLLKGKRQ